MVVERVGLPAVLKAQTPFGGRGNIGAVKFAESVDQAVIAANALLGICCHLEGGYRFSHDGAQIYASQYASAKATQRKGNFWSFYSRCRSYRFFV